MQSRAKRAQEIQQICSLFLERQPGHFDLCKAFNAWKHEGVRERLWQYVLHHKNVLATGLFLLENLESRAWATRIGTDLMDRDGTNVDVEVFRSIVGSPKCSSKLRRTVSAYALLGHSQSHLSDQQLLDLMKYAQIPQARAIAFYLFTKHGERLNSDALIMLFPLLPRKEKGAVVQRILELDDCTIDHLLTIVKTDGDLVTLPVIQRLVALADEPQFRQMLFEWSFSASFYQFMRIGREMLRTDKASKDLLLSFIKKDDYRRLHRRAAELLIRRYLTELTPAQIGEILQHRVVFAQKAWKMLEPNVDRFTKKQLLQIREANPSIATLVDDAIREMEETPPLEKMSASQLIGAMEDLLKKKSPLDESYHEGTML